MSSYKEPGVGLGVLWSWYLEWGSFGYHSLSLYAVGEVLLLLLGLSFF